MHSIALTRALKQWESKESTVEKKIDALQKAVFEHVGLKEDPEYYYTHGKFFERYVAGFLSSFFWQLSDISFILLDPLHIFDIITTFIKTLFKHPIRLLKQILGTWVWSFTHGAFGLGFVTAAALLTFLMAAAVSIFSKGILGGLRSAASTIPQSLVSEVTYVTDKIVGVGQRIKEGVSYTAKLFADIQENPQLVLAQAKESILSGVSYGRIREFKFYTNPYLKNRA